MGNNIASLDPKTTPASRFEVATLQNDRGISTFMPMSSQAPRFQSLLQEGLR